MKEHVFMESTTDDFNEQILRATFQCVEEEKALESPVTQTQEDLIKTMALS